MRTNMRMSWDFVMFMMLINYDWFNLGISLIIQIRFEYVKWKINFYKSFGYKNSLTQHHINSRFTKFGIKLFCIFHETVSVRFFFLILFWILIRFLWNFKVSIRHDPGEALVWMYYVFLEGWTPGIRFGRTGSFY